MMRITKKQFEYYLYQFKREGIVYSYQLVELEDVYEYVYKIRLVDCYDSFLLYSSIDVGNGISRDYATDRIRFIRVENGDKYTRIFRINRVDGWQNRLRKGMRMLIKC